MKHTKTPAVRADPGYEAVLADVVGLVAAARRVSARTVNAILTTTYWSIGRRIVEQEQRGAARAAYGEELVERLSRDLSERIGRGFGRANLFQMRALSRVRLDNRAESVRSGKSRRRLDNPPTGPALPP